MTTEFTDENQKKQINEEEEDEHEKEVAGRNGMWGTTLAIISTIMGGGIVSIPYAYSVAGIGVGVSI